MKRLFALVLLAAMTLSFCACMGQQEDVTFYYVRNEDKYLYGQPGSVMSGELRDVSGHTEDLRYMLILYFHGPTGEALRSPFPSGTTLQSVEREKDALYIELSSIVSVLQGTDLTLACACLAKTCFGLTDAQSVTIFSEGLGFVSMTLTRDSLMLVDDMTIPPTETT